MDLNGVGLLGAIIVGGLAGWLAEKFMKSDMGIFMNIVLGIIGAAALNFVLSLLGIYTGTGWLIYLIVGFIGACLLIAIARAVRR
ncbi:MAG: GlsB/YeaQ/YmgE family stress response membrane protein [Rhizobiales bacterium]|nr:GlsB/YeaQ/YmgE family stress response membrane protein [Hyphomicrobiales bacterium]MBA69096.1 GlsB/YeaQ/YmgE family stress response membrane protein [Hyphomicrobiales bacterium]|tara:strand:+ start:789 stop:1043 length:255 start_codon:yes stop_codon:yes gene_type:complete